MNQKSTQQMTAAEEFAELTRPDPHHETWCDQPRHEQVREEIGYYVKCIGRPERLPTGLESGDELDVLLEYDHHGRVVIRVDAGWMGSPVDLKDVVWFSTLLTQSDPRPRQELAEALGRLRDQALAGSKGSDVD